MRSSYLPCPLSSNFGAIDVYREDTGAGLREAKKVVKALFADRKLTF
jgi:ribosomal protein L7/L12